MDLRKSAVCSTAGIRKSEPGKVFWGEIIPIPLMNAIFLKYQGGIVSAKSK